jgi:aspartyl-tRNA(Asn)/glutamyl-tRNA(Gln) amidotransferase subunit B
VARLLNAEGGERELADTPLTPKHIAELALLVEAGEITGTSAKEVLEAAFESGEAPATIVAARGLGQVRDEAEIERLAQQVVSANPKAVADFRGGKEGALKFLVGQLMREARGRADATSAADVLRRHLETLS